MELKTRDYILISLFAALTAIGAFLKIPIPPVPFSLQNLFCAYAGLLLGARRGLYSQLLYVGIGLIGIPIFTQGGGPSYIFQPTFGFLLGFIVGAYVIGKLTEKLEKVTLINVLIPLLIGLFFIYSIGVTYMYLILNFYVGKMITFATALKLGFFPFILKDLLISVIIAKTAVYIIPILRRAGLLNEAY